LGSFAKETRKIIGRTRIVAPKKKSVLPKIRQDLHSPLAYPPLANFVFLSLPFFFFERGTFVFFDYLPVIYCSGFVFANQASTRFNLDSLPFRFKGSNANMAPAQTVHHHRSTTKVSHKPYKSKHASKGALKDLAKGMILDQPEISEIAILTFIPL
jgi:hypothetical protein